MTSTELAPPKRGRETAWDMIRSLGLIAVIIGVTLLFVPSLIHPSKSDRFQAFDYSGYVEGFHIETHQNALTPSPVPSNFIANAATLTGPAAAEHLHIGFATPGSAYVGLDEALGASGPLIQKVLGAPGGKVTGLVSIGGMSWQRRTSARGEQAITRRIGDVYVVITGNGTPAQFQALATSLKPAPRQVGPVTTS